MMKSGLINLFFLTSIIGLSACSNNVQEIDGAQNSSFLVSQIQATSEAIPNAAIPAVKDASFVHYKACLKDAAVQSPLVGEKFEVIMNERQYALSTDIEGCLAWSDAMTFDWLDDEKWVENNFSIRAKGTQLGEVTIATLVNPWREGSQAIVDTRYHRPVGLITTREEIKLQKNSTKTNSLNISNLNWKVIRRRQRENQTILEWKIEGSPVLERIDISGQQLRTELETGRANISIALISSNMNGSQEQIHENIVRDISWQSSLMKLEGEVAIDTEKLPRLGELAKLQIELTLPSNMAKTKGYIQLSGLEQSQGFEFQRGDNLDVDQFNLRENVHNDVVGHLDISSLKIAIDTDDMEGYFLDENLNLSITKAFRVEMNPKVILPGASVLGTPPTTLTSGKLDLRVHIFSPNKAGLNFEQPDLEQFTHLATTQQEVTIRPDGLISKLFKFPTAISRSPLLRLKTLIVIEARPIDTISNISPMVFNAEFYPLASSNDVTLYAQEDFSQSQDQIARRLYDDTRGLSARDSFSYQGLKSRLEMLSTLEGHQFNFKFLSQLTDRKIDTKVARLARTSVSGLTQADMRILMSSRKLPKSALAKLCNEFFTPSTVSREFNWGRFEDKLKGGEKWQQCLENPSNFIKVSPSDHVESFVKEERIGDIKVTKPIFVSQAKGEIFRGVGFFAAYGDRSSQGDGERDATTVESHVGFELSIPFIASVGIGGDRSQSVYQAREKASMQSSFERQYTQQSDIELEYNRITLEFLARMRRCLSVQSESAKKTMLICDDNDRLTKAQENWYFIGDTRLNKVGVITNSTMPGGLEMAQVLRGETSFKKIWGEFRAEDRALVLEKLDAGAQSILQKPITQQLSETPEVIGVGFPGIIVPY